MEPSVVILIVDRHCMFYRVINVLVGDAVLTRRQVDLHRAIVLRNRDGERGTILEL